MGTLLKILVPVVAGSSYPRRWSSALVVPVRRTSSTERNRPRKERFGMLRTRPCYSSSGCLGFHRGCLIGRQGDESSLEEKRVPRSPRGEKR